jgi:hypothetical protein
MARKKNEVARGGQFGALVGSVLLAAVVMPAFLMATHASPAKEDEEDRRPESTVDASADCAPGTFYKVGNNQNAFVRRLITLRGK